MRAEQLLGNHLRSIAETHLHIRNQLPGHGNLGLFDPDVLWTFDDGLPKRIAYDQNGYPGPTSLTTEVIKVVAATPSDWKGKTFYLRKVQLVQPTLVELLA